jgi:hypothetical protein
MSSELLIHEQVVSTEPVEFDAPVLLTVVTFNNERRQLTRESHVFIPATGVYLHQVCYRTYQQQQDPAIVACSVDATHRLLDEHLATVPFLSNFPEVRCVSLETRRVAGHSFHHFKIRNKFIQQMWEIQEWTSSTELRRVLADVMSYRCDKAEGELLTRIFNREDHPAMPSSTAVATDLLPKSHSRFER